MEIEKLNMETQNKMNELFSSLLLEHQKINKIKHSKEEWNDARKQREGLPYYKNQSMKTHLSDYRN